MELTIEQTELLFIATDVFHMWYTKYYPDPPSYSELLKINHVKILDIFDGYKYTDEEVVDILENLIITYNKLLEDY